MFSPLFLLFEEIYFINSSNYAFGLSEESWHCKKLIELLDKVKVTQLVGFLFSPILLPYCNCAKVDDGRSTTVWKYRFLILKHTLTDIHRLHYTDK